MDVKTTWEGHDQSIIRLEMSGKWTWTVCQNLVYTLFDYVKTLETRIDAIVDLSGAGAMPVDASTYCFNETLRRAPENYGLMVLVGPDRFTRLLISIIQRQSLLMRKKIVMADNLNEARKLIAEAREPVPSL